MEPTNDPILHAFESDLHAALTRGMTALEQDLLRPFSSRVAAVRTAHAALLDQLQRAAEDPNLGDADTPMVPGQVLWEAVQGYRIGVQREVLIPLAQQLEQLDLGQALAAERRALADALLACADTLPETVVREEPDDLYQADTDDSAMRRVRKAAVRLRRNLSDKDDHRQTVPLRHLALYHAQVRMTGALLPHLETLKQNLALPLAAFERRVTAHTHALLALEHILDRPAYHEPPARLAQPATPPDPTRLAETAAAVEQLHAQATVFDQALPQLGEAITLALKQLHALPETLASQHEAFHEDVLHADTFMLDLDDRAPAPPKAVAKVEKHVEAWAQWFARVAARLRFCDDLLGFSGEVYAQVEAFVSGIVAAGVQPVQQALIAGESALRAHLPKLDDVFAEKTLRAQRAALENMQAEALRSVEQETRKVLHEGKLARAVREAADVYAGRCAALPERLPETATLNVLHEPSAETVDPTVEGWTCQTRALAQRTFDALLTERLRTSVMPLLETLARIRTEADGVPAIVRFNLESAEEELYAMGQAEDAAAKAEHAASARELAEGGLDRSADALAGLVGVLHAAVPAVAQRIQQPARRSFEQWHDRVRIEEPMHAFVVDFRHEVAQRMRAWSEAAQQQAERGGVLFKRRFRQGRTQATQWMYLGKAAVGRADADDAERESTVEALSAMGALLNELPVVYRRLFAFRPVTDPALLAGREGDLERLEKHVTQWQRGFTNAYVLTGMPGSGLTSFLQVARQTVLAEAEVRMLTLPRRLRHEADLAALLAETLGAPPTAATSLDALAAHLLGQPAPARLRVVCVERLEHLLLRGVAGTNLLEQALTFLSQTDSRVLWLGTLNDFGWQLATKTEPAAVSLVVRHALAPLNRETLEALILSRHQRSGLPLTFLVPDLKGVPLLRRRLRRASDEEARQALLRADYFDRLYRACGQNVMLELLYWLRSVEIDEDAEQAQVHPVEPLSFAFFSTFDLPRTFTLKTFLEHATLTIAEHSEALRLSEEESLQHFEALGNLLLIEPAPDGSEAAPRTAFTFTAIDERTRYRLRPVVIQPVVQYLRGKNIVH